MDSEKIESGFRTLGPIPKNAPLGLRKGACDLADFPSKGVEVRPARVAKSGVRPPLKPQVGLFKLPSVLAPG